jgi:phospholipase C
MLENRSFDHMLGFLYPKSADFDGLDGTESNADESGNQVTVFPITADMQNAYYYPLANPAEGYASTNHQLFNSGNPPASGVATNDGFAASFDFALKHPAHAQDPKLVGAAPASIMGMYAPETLPVLSGLAKGFAVCDAWFASVPTQTFPNRAFAVAGTSLGHVCNHRPPAPPTFNTVSVFGKLDDKGQTWKIYGFSGTPLTADDFLDTVTPGKNGEVVSGFARFQADAASGGLAAFSYLEPEWATYPPKSAPPDETQTDDQHNWHIENDQHPVSNLAVGEKLLYDVYQALRNGPAWGKTLLIITYDEHGGNYDHVHPPTGAIAPDGHIGTSHFDFTRFGVRVPAVLVSPLIPEGTILHAPSDGPPFDHTSIIATLRARFGLGALGKRDAAAPDVSSVLTLSAPRSDDPLASVVPPAASDPVLQPGSPPVGAAPSSFLEAKAVAAAALPVPGDPIADPGATVKALSTAAEQYEFIQQRQAAWQAAGRPLQ